MFKVTIQSKRSDAVEFTNIQSTKLERCKDYVDDMSALWPADIRLGVYDTKTAQLVYEVDGLWAFDEEKK
jgi:hypothetical protein